MSGGLVMIVVIFFCWWTTYSAQLRQVLWGPVRSFAVFSITLLAVHFETLTTSAMGIKRKT